MGSSGRGHAYQGSASRDSRSDTPGSDTFRALRLNECPRPSELPKSRGGGGMAGSGCRARGLAILGQPTSGNGGGRKLRDASGRLSCVNSVLPRGSLGESS